MVDPDDHHLFASLGCAVENLVVAAAAQGLHAHVDCAPDGGRIRVAFDATRPVDTPLAAAIAARQCTRAEYDRRPVPPEDLDRIAQTGTSAYGGVCILTSRTDLNVIADLVAEGNRRQLADPAFVAELQRWVRFNRREATRTGDGLTAGATGNPASPRWVARVLPRLVFSARRQNARDMRHIRSAAAVAVFYSSGDDAPHWVDAGRRYERLALQSTTLGLRHAFANQPVEVPQLRRQLGDWLALGAQRLDLIVRLGYGPRMPRSPRRPLDAVLVTDEGEEANARR